MRYFLLTLAMLASLLATPALAQDTPDSGTTPDEFHILVYKYCGEENGWPQTHRFAVYNLTDAPLEPGEYVYWFEEDSPSTREHELRLDAHSWAFLQWEGATATLTIVRPEQSHIRATWSCGLLDWWMWIPFLSLSEL